MSDPVVPREFVGLARAFFNKVQASEQQYIAMRARVWAPLKQRLDRIPLCPTWRKPECVDLFKVWSSCPGFGRIENYTCWKYTKRRVEFADARLMTAQRQLADGGTEPAVAVSLVRLVGDIHFVRDEDGALDLLIAQPINHIVVVGLHALARYFQKGFQPSEAALIASLWNTFWLARQALRPGAFQFAVPCGNGGHWHGYLITRQGTGKNGVEPGQLDEPYTSLDVRTYHTDRADPSLWVSPAPDQQEAA